MQSLEDYEGLIRLTTMPNPLVGMANVSTCLEILRVIVEKLNFPACLTVDQSLAGFFVCWVFFFFYLANIIWQTLQKEARSWDFSAHLTLDEMLLKHFVTAICNPF